jgi:general secretion pathway protein K
VLWLTAALSAIAFSVANTVRGEIERTATAVDGLRGAYLAEGAIDRTILYMLWGPSHRNPDGSPRYWIQGMPRLYHSFPGGDAIVEVIPARAALNLNVATEEELFRLLLALGAEPARARDIALGIVDWRSPRADGGDGLFAQIDLSGPPSFRPRHASFEEVEEVLFVRGMTPELFYGSYVREPDGRLVRRGGFRDCVSVQGSKDRFDVNSAEPALLVSLGVEPAAVEQIVRTRRAAPILPGQLDGFRAFAGPGGDKLSTGGGSIFTLRATARHRLGDGRLSDLRRTAAASVKFFGYGFNPPYQVLRWYDSAPADAIDWP